MLGKDIKNPMENIKSKLKYIADLIPPGSPVYYIDYPVYSNGGDLLIMKGTEEFFDNYGVNVKKRYSVFDYPHNRITVSSDVVFILQGGGNFGDLYPLHQNLRERIISEHKDNKIIIMPQTIFYENNDEFIKTANKISGHKDLHLFLRDKVSYENAKRYFQNCHVYLSPDMAHELWPIRSTNEPIKEKLNFFRVDVEKTDEQKLLELDGEGDFKDWNSIFTSLELKLIKVIAKLLKYKLPVRKIWYYYSDYLINKAVREFSNYKNIKTSRLHGHILSCLMNKPNELLDNSYGKNKNYYKEWTQDTGISTISNNTGILEEKLSHGNDQLKKQIEELQHSL